MDRPIINFPPPPNFNAIGITVTTRQLVFRYDQIVRLAVQLLGTPFSSQIGSGGFTDAATWTALLSETDDTQIILSPLFSGTKLSPSKKLATGADTNATFQGTEQYFGEGVAMLTAHFLDLDSPSINTFFDVVSGFTMNNGNPMAGVAGAGAYLINKDNVGFSTSSWGAFPIFNLTARSTSSDGFATSNVTGFDCGFFPYWDGSSNSPTPSNVALLGGDVNWLAYP